jgi:hypothetical protein
MRKVLAAIGLFALCLALVPAGAARASASSPETITVRGGITSSTSYVPASVLATPPCSSGDPTDPRCTVPFPTPVMGILSPVSGSTTWSGSWNGQSKFTVRDGRYNTVTKRADATIDETLLENVFLPDSSTDPCAVGSTTTCTGTLHLAGTVTVWGGNMTGEVRETIACGGTCVSTDRFYGSSGNVVFDVTAAGSSGPQVGGYKGSWTCPNCPAVTTITTSVPTTPPPAGVPAIPIRGGFTQAASGGITCASSLCSKELLPCPTSDSYFDFFGGSPWLGSLTGQTLINAVGCSNLTTGVGNVVASETLEIGPPDVSTTPPTPGGLYTPDYPQDPCSPYYPSSPSAKFPCAGYFHLEETDVSMVDTTSARLTPRSRAIRASRIR